ncbi:MAG: YbjQ family protein [Gemmataceae bacterium]
MELRRDDLCAGTRPEITDGRILLTGSDGFDGYEITEYLGMVWGISVRSKDFGQDFAMGCKRLTGGELQSYAALANESRQRAVDRMMQMASRQGANAIINVQFELAGAAQGDTQVVANGTAVIIHPVWNYIPTGAMGNIVYEIGQFLGQKGKES